MNSPQNTETGTAQVQAHYSAVRKLGHWTTDRRVTVRATRGHVTLDLRSPRIPAGDIEIELTADRSMLKLLVPDDAIVDHWDLRQVGRCRVKDGRFEETSTSRTIRITGELRRGEIRIRRGGVAVLSAMFTREYAEDVLRAHKEGTIPTMDDPVRNAPGTPRPTRK
jgi:hypothetical protein